MSKDKREPPAGGDGYEIGYGRPPRHSQFRAGQSGNRAGRPKGVRNLMTDVRRTLKVPVKVKEDGRSRRISTQEGMLMLLREKALKGDGRSLDRLLELAVRFNNDPGAEAAQQVLPDDDRAILADYVAEVTAAMAPSSAKPTGTPRIKMRRRSQTRKSPQ
jgi:hypothetical protein